MTAKAGGVVRTGKLVPAASTPLSGLMVLQEVVGAVNSWVQIHETEVTKRAGIAAAEKIALAEITAKRELFLTYLNRSFDEREQTFTQLFAALDRALSAGSGDVGPILNTITALAAKSPFADLHDIDLVKSSLADPDHEWQV